MKFLLVQFPNVLPLLSLLLAYIFKLPCYCRNRHYLSFISHHSNPGHPLFCSQFFAVSHLQCLTSLFLVFVTGYWSISQQLYLSLGSTVQSSTENLLLSGARGSSTQNHFTIKSLTEGLNCWVMRPGSQPVWALHHRRCRSRPSSPSGCGSFPIYTDNEHVPSGTSSYEGSSVSLPT